MSLTDTLRAAEEPKEVPPTLPEDIRRFAPPEQRREMAREKRNAARDRANLNVAVILRKKVGPEWRRNLRAALEAIHDPAGAEAVRVYQRQVLDMPKHRIGEYFDLGPADHFLVWLVQAGFRIERIGHEKEMQEPVHRMRPPYRGPQDRRGQETPEGL